MERIKETLSSEEARSVIHQCAYLTAAFPLDYAKTLMQIGYEPFPPTEGTFIFGKPYLALPNTFQYLKYIKSVDGFFGCYRGLAPRICQSIVSQAVYSKIACRNPFMVDGQLNRHSRGSKEQIKLSSARSGAYIRGSQVADDFKGAVKNTGWDILCTSVATVASQPFCVIAVKTMAQFVGRETKYNTIFDAIQTIFREDGLLGFFKGVVPRLVGDAIYIVLSATMVFGLRNYLSKEARGTQLESATFMLANVVSSSYTYQFNVVSSVMIVNNSPGLAVGHYPFTKQYDGWYECWKALGSIKQLKRGSSIIGRYYNGPTIVVSGSRRPTGYYFGPQHPPGLGFKENCFNPVYPSILKPSSA